MDSDTDTRRTLSWAWTNAATHRALAGLLLLIALMLVARTATAQSGWTPTDLGTLPGSDGSTALAINNAGQIVGSSRFEYLGYPYENAFLWTPSGGMTKLTNLDTLGGPSSIATGINDVGQVVGYSNLWLGGYYHAFLWTAASGMIDLGTLGGPNSWATGINNVGQVVGYSNPPGGGYHAFLWTAASGMTDLGTLPGFFHSQASGINNAGQVVGFSSPDAGGEHAFLWTAAGGMVDLGSLGGYGQGGRAYGINDAGQVVGDSNTLSGTHAFLWTAAGGMVDLATLAGNSSANGINDAAQVIGVGGGHAFIVWTAAGGMVDLGTLGGSRSAASGINGAGQVVGSSETGNGQSHAVLWNPPAPLAVTAFTSSATFPVTAGTPVTWTATASGGIAPSYQFWVFNGITWTLGRDWGSANRWTWEPPVPGTYTVQVWVRNAGSASAYDAWLGATATITMPSVLTVTTVTPNAAAVPAGTPVTWTPTILAGTGPYTYQFWVYDGAAWTVAQAWSASPTWTWTPPAAGTYAFQVWVRNAGSGTVYDTWHAFGPYTATRPAALTITTLAPDRATAPAGTPVRWTATNAGGSGPPAYSFYVFDGSTWALGQDGTPSSSWTWIPPAAGTYWVQAWAQWGSGALNLAWRSAGPYTVTAATALDVTSLVADHAFPIPTRTPVQWTARATGGTGPYTYRFDVYDGSTWAVGQDWSPSSTWTWIPPASGTYQVQARVRNAGSVADYDDWAGVAGVTVSGVTPISMPSVTMTPMAPLVVGGPAVVTATASGGSGPYTYVFYVFNGTTWTVGQVWSTWPTYVWTPPAAGTYWLQVWVRNAGSVSTWDAWADFGPLAVLP